MGDITMTPDLCFEYVEEGGPNEFKTVFVSYRSTPVSGGLTVYVFFRKKIN